MKGGASDARVIRRPAAASGGLREPDGVREETGRDVEGEPA
jgi:hypothetical protein